MEGFKYCNHRKKFVLMVLWCIVFGVLIYVSHVETLPHKAAVDVYDVPSYSVDFDIMNYFERKAYERVLLRYQLRVMRTFVIGGIGLLGLFYILRPRKIQIGTDGIKVFSIYKKKPYFQKEWNEIREIHIGSAEGIHGMLGDRGIKITWLNTYESEESEYFSLWAYSVDEFLEITEKNNVAGVSLKKDMSFHSNVSFKEMITSAIEYYKVNRNEVWLYSGIVLIFALSQRFLIGSTAGIIAAIASINFGYRALIAMNYSMLSRYNGEASLFDENWNYGKGLLKRYIGATVLRDLVPLGLMALLFLVVSAEIAIIVKLGFSMVLGIIAYIIYSRLFLAPYIAGIVDQGSSYLRINSIKYAQYKKEVLFLTIFGALQIVILYVLVWILGDNLNTLNEILTILTYGLLVIQFFVRPFISGCSMKLLYDLPKKVLVVDEGELADEESV